VAPTRYQTIATLVASHHRRPAQPLQDSGVCHAIHACWTWPCSASRPLSIDLPKNQLMQWTVSDVIDTKAW
jgi:hypothetical protein